jgi:3-oxoacyl-[acyl-carrier-protein] synthase-3
MAEPPRSVIIGTGSYLPERAIPNSAFHDAEFYDPDGARLDAPAEAIVAKFEQITGIRERRYVGDELVTSDIAALAAERAVAAAGIDPESLDYVIVGHNFGDVTADNRRSELVPSLAARVKSRLGVDNPRTIAYDLPFGCPGWLQAVIQADYYLRSGDARRALVIGAEVLSRVCDPHDRDSMIYADGAGAVVLEARPSAEPVGILAHAARSDTIEHAFLLRMGGSCCPDLDGGGLYLKMDGHKVYEYAVTAVPTVVEECLAKAGLGVGEVAKILVHQANAKLDQAIVKRLLRAAGVRTPAEELVPMTVGWLGNSSVATLPTLFDLLSRGELDGHRVGAGDLIVFASVGAGMNANALAYRMG